jgi:hypothetical protein
MQLGEARHLAHPGRLPSLTAREKCGMTLSTRIDLEDYGYLTYYFNPVLKRHVVYSSVLDQDSFVNGSADEAIMFLAPYRYSEDVGALITWLRGQS